MALNAHADHGHAVDLTVALDFVNTLELCATRSHPEFGGTHESLETPSDAIGWLLGRELVHPTALDGAAGQATLDRVRQVREAFRDLIEAAAERRTPSEDAIRIVNGLLASRQVPMLEPEPDGVRLSHRHVANPIDEALAVLAEPIVERIAEERSDRFRICANDMCRYAFFDESRAGRRRWCDMASCGNRAKAARHRARQKDS